MKKEEKKSVGEEVNTPFNPAEALVLPVASMQSLQLFFTIVKNFKPLVKEMLNFDSFEEFSKKYATTKFKDFPF